MACVRIAGGIRLRRQRIQFLYSAWCLVIGLFMMVAPLRIASAQPTYLYSESQADLHIEVAAGRSAKISLTLAQEPDDVEELTQVLSRSLGMLLNHIRPHWQSGRWVLFARTDSLYPRKGLISEGQIRPAPLREWLDSHYYYWLSISIHHPDTPYTRAEPGGKTYSSKANHITHLYYIPPSTPETASRGITFAFGYTWGDLGSRFWLLLLPLLLPILLLALARRRALLSREDDTVAIWFAFGRFSQGIIRAMWLIWLALLFLTRVRPAVTFIWGSSGYETDVGLFFLVVLVPPLLIQIYR
jgi:hypothetical protein